MTIITEPDYASLGHRVATDLLAIVCKIKNPVICPTSGSTPLALYQSLVKLVREQNIDYSGWYFVGLDEWAGMNGRDKGSCREFVDTELFLPLEIAQDHICFFDGRAANGDSECERVETFITKHGGLTVAVVGLGLNGHIGMNEPGTPASVKSHVAEIAPETQQIGQKYFDEPRIITHGLTLGLATLRAAEHLFIMVNGEKKAAVVKQILEEQPSETVPATLLRDHPQARLYLDSAAAQLL